MNRRHLTASALLAFSLLGAACGSDGDDPAGSKGKDGGTVVSAGGNAADVAFLRGMKPHHEQAVEMSDLVLATNPPADVAALARRIKGAQSPEIGQMDRLMTGLGEKVDRTVHRGGHRSGMAGHGGMMTSSEMDALMDATGTKAARLYLEGMVKHHQGAIDASTIAIEDGRYAPAVELARTIKTAQTAEIVEIRDLLEKL